MSKMAKLFKAQKPGKNRAKNNSVEQLIQATCTGLAKSKLILGDIQDIIQKSNALHNVGGKKKQVNGDSLKTNSVRSPTEATKANTKPGNARNPAREGIGASLHLCRNRLNNLENE